MKTIYIQKILITYISFINFYAYSRAGIGITILSKDAVLELQSNNKEFLLSHQSNIESKVNPITNGNSIAEVTTCGAGDMIVGIPVFGVTQSITVMVRRVGTYNYWASANGVTFSASGYSESTGEKRVTLIASGTPLNEGSFDFFVNSSSGRCTFTRKTNNSPPFSLTSLTGHICQDRNLEANKATSSATDYIITHLFLQFMIVLILFLNSATLVQD